MNNNFTGRQICDKYATAENKSNAKTNIKNAYRLLFLLNNGPSECHWQL